MKLYNRYAVGNYFLTKQMFVYVAPKRSQIEYFYSFHFN